MKLVLISIITGLFMIGLGFLAKSYPNLIAGYNTMPKEKKKNVDVEGLSTCVKNGLIIMGIIIIACSCILKIFHLEWFGGIPIQPFIGVVVGTIGAIVTSVKTKKYDHNSD